jgi:phosphoribosylaminoimidazolecarboxamide formyltransferase/IMP cyclohydrolase
LLDLDAAWRAAISFEKPTVVIVKHLSPCGIASADDVASAFPLALASDPVSAFGGVIAANQSFDGEVAGLLGDLFVECIAALGFDEEACSVLAERKNCRLLQMPSAGLEPRPELRSIVAGVLRQDLDIGDPVAEVGEWRVLTERVPSDDEWKSLRFAWTACQHVKSNAIVLVQGEATVGIGGGQPNRVDCVRIAGERSGKQSQGAVMASDAFFPFPDSVEEAATLGVRAIVQPGGSVRDQLSIDAANTAGMAMVATGVRHFRH